MRQRLSLARALLNQPSLLVLDEPFTGLDRRGREQVSEVLAEAKEAGAMILLSTHALDMDSALVDRVLVLRRGKIRYDGSAPESFAALYDEVLS